MPNPEDDSPLLVFTTLANRSDAQALVAQLVTDKLAACGTILAGATSVYRWKGEVTSESEVFVILKTRRGRWAALRRAVESNHPYDVPELLAIPSTDGLPAYMQWIVDETTTVDAETR